MSIVYSVVKRFDPACGERWQDFINWSGLTQLREIVSLDIILCPTVIRELTDEDWRHNLQEEFKITLFRDLDYLLRRAGDLGQVNVLALIQNPAPDELQLFSDRRFHFRGFDLVELQTGISALVNCGGFDKAFAGSDLSECGLLIHYADALRVQKRLPEEYPSEPHANCDLWAIWQLSEPKEQGATDVKDNQYVLPR
jgi:hypothetical protein